MTTFRLLQTGHKSAAFNMALDEVLIDRIHKGLSKPTLRFYGWGPSAVSIGYFQSIQAEVDLDKCQELSVETVRRQTGGGAVFHDQEVTYSIHVPMDLKLIPEEILPSYEKISGGIIKGLGNLGLEAKFAPLNDILVGGQKISGNAQTRKRSIVLQHGTVLVDLDVDKMFDLLKVPDEKMKGKLISAIKERVTSISKHNPEQTNFQNVVDNLIDGFEKEFPEVNFQVDELTEEELAEAQKLADDKYKSKTWNYQR